MRRTIDIPVEEIKTNRYQPRLEFEEGALMELAQSIRENGLIQPITVCERDGKYEIVAGERRYRACILAGFTEIPAIIMETSDDQLAERALVENIQRENLSAIEEAKAYMAILEKTGMTQEEMALRMGKSQSTIANKIRLLNLPQEIQDAIASRQLTERHARALLKLDGTAQENAYQKIVKQGYNVRQSEELIEQILTPKETKKKQSLKGITRNLRIAFNTVYSAVNMIKKTGIKIETEEMETENDVRIIIKFPKTK